MPAGLGARRAWREQGRPNGLSTTAGRWVCSRDSSRWVEVCGLAWCRRLCGSSADATDERLYGYRCCSSCPYPKIGGADEYLHCRCFGVTITLERFVNFGLRNGYETDAFSREDHRIDHGEVGYRGNHPSQRVPGYVLHPGTQHKLVDRQQRLKRSCRRQ